MSWSNTRPTTTAHWRQLIQQQLMDHDARKSSEMVTMIRDQHAQDKHQYITLSVVIVRVVPLLLALTFFAMGVRSVVLCTVFVPILWTDVAAVGAISLVTRINPTWHLWRSLVASSVFSLLLIAGVLSFLPLLSEVFDFSEVYHTTRLSVSSLWHGAVMVVCFAAYSINLLVGIHCYATRQIDTLASDGAH